MPNYVEGTEIKLKVRDRILVDAEFFNGDKIEGLQPRRLFPVSGLSRYIALMDEEGEAICIISNLDDLMPESRAAIASALDEYYMIPKIHKVTKWREKYGYHVWTAETNHGQVDIEISDSSNHVKKLYDDRVLVKDASDNRYEIPDLKKLDANSLKLIMPDI